MLLIFLIISPIISTALCKNNVKSLTESMGQEVIEIGAPIKDLPPGLEEEPSAENDDDDKSATIILLPAATKKDIKKSNSMTTLQKVPKDIGKSSSNNQEDDEARIEKELAEIYKDNADYKADSSEVFNGTSTLEPTYEDKPIARQRTSFKFQPDIDNKAEIERFRTSIDDISCAKRVTKKLSMEETTDVSDNSASRPNIEEAVIGLIFCLSVICC